MNTSVLSVAAILALAAPLAAAQDFPKAPVQIIVPYAPGGNLDITTRIVAPALGEALGTTVVVQNRPGAGGSVGATQASLARPDGYTLLTTATTELTVTPHIANAPYGIKDFTLIGTVSTVPMIIGVTPDGKYQSFDQLLAAACAKPGSVSIGIAGVGSVNYMALLRLQEATRCEFLMVPYQGSGPALLGVLGNQTDAIIDQVSSSRPHLDAKRLKAIVVLSDDKASGLEDVPSLSRSEVKGADMATVTAFVAPAGLPADVTTKLREALRKALGRKDVQQRIAELGGLAFTGDKDDFMEMIRPLEDMALRYKAAGKLQAN